MDGTLVDNIPYHLQAFDAQAKKHGYKLLGPVDSRYYGWHNFDILPDVVPQEVIEKYGLQFLSDEKEEIYREIYAPHIKLMNGLDEMLDEARAMGLRCYVGSAGPRLNVEFIVNGARLLERFEGYVSADDVTKCKPDPEIFLTCCKRLGVDPSEAIVFEDAPSGVRAGVSAGTPVVGILSTTPAETLLSLGAKTTAKDFSEFNLKEFIDSLNE